MVKSTKTTQSVRSNRRLVWHSGSPTSASSRVGGCIPKYRASVTAGAQVREGDELGENNVVCVGYNGGWGAYKEAGLDIC
jgi:hypothetical protein